MISTQNGFLWKSLLAALLWGVLAACQRQGDTPVINSLRESPSRSSHEGDRPSVLGVIAGQEEAGMSAVVSLRYLQSPFCSGALVGLNPPTVITAKHCAVDVATEIFSVLPEKILTRPFEGFEFNPEEKKVPGDLAVLIYPSFLAEALEVKPEEVFTVAPVDIKAFDNIFFCGFGHTSSASKNATGAGNKRCGSNQVLLEDERFDFTKEMSSFILFFRDIRKDFAVFTQEEKVKYVHTRLQTSMKNYGPGAYVGVGRFTREAFRLNPKRGYDESGRTALLNQGDSGGPWFIRKNGSPPHLIAVSSLGLTLKNANEDVIAALGWRLDHPWSKAFLQWAAQQGAHITGLEELLRDPKRSPQREK